MKNRIKFYSGNDLSIGFFKPRIDSILQSYEEKTIQEKTIEDIIELKIVTTFIEKQIFFNDWNEEDKSKYISYLPLMKKEVNKFFSRKTKKELMCIMEKFFKEKNFYTEELLDLMIVCKCFNEIKEDEFFRICKKTNIHVSILLKKEMLVKKYPNLIKKLFLLSEKNIELLMDNAFKKGNYIYYIPRNITKKEWNIFLLKYINSKKANLYYLKRLLHRLGNFNGSEYICVTEDIKLKILKRINQITQEFDIKENGFKQEIVICSDKKTYFQLKNNKSILCDLVDSDYFKVNKGYKDLLDYIIYRFSLINPVGLMSTICFENIDISSLEKSINIQSQYEYKTGIFFFTKEKFYLLKIEVLIKIINQNKLNIEKFIKWFFEEFSLKNYAIQWLKISIPCENEELDNKTSILFKIEENIRKQYYLFCKYGEIDRGMYNALSNVPSLDSLPSYLKRKYIKINPRNREINYIIQLLFFTGVTISNINEYCSADTFYDLLKGEDVYYTTYTGHNKNYIDTLINNKLLKNENNRLSFVNEKKIEILKSLYYYSEVNYLFLSDSEVTIIEEFLSLNWVVFSNNLFSEKESNYLNYMLNEKQFINSRGLRNTYQHGGPIYDEVNKYKEDYLMSIIILISYVVKIYEELEWRKLK